VCMRRCGRGRGKAREDKTDKHGTCSVAVHLQLVLHRPIWEDGLWDYACALAFLFGLVGG